jgi:hypothetical protein
VVHHVCETHSFAEVPEFRLEENQVFDVEVGAALAAPKAPRLRQFRGNLPDMSLVCLTLTLLFVYPTSMSPVRSGQELRLLPSTSFFLLKKRERL